MLSLHNGDIADKLKLFNNLPTENGVREKVLARVKHIFQSRLQSYASEPKLPEKLIHLYVLLEVKGLLTDLDNATINNKFRVKLENSSIDKATYDLFKDRVLRNIDEAKAALHDIKKQPEPTSLRAVVPKEPHLSHSKLDVREGVEAYLNSKDFLLPELVKYGLMPYLKTDDVEFDELAPGQDAYSKDLKSTNPLEADVSPESVDIDLSKIRLIDTDDLFYGRKEITWHDYIKRELQRTETPGARQTYANAVAAEKGLIAEFTPVTVFSETGTRFRMLATTPDPHGKPMINMHMVVEEADEPGLFRVVEKLQQPWVLGTPRSEPVSAWRPGHQIRATGQVFTNSLFAGEHKAGTNGNKRKYVLTAPVRFNAPNTFCISVTYPNGKEYPLFVSQEFTVEKTLKLLEEKTGQKPPENQRAILKDHIGRSLQEDKALSYYGVANGKFTELKVTFQPQPLVHFPVRITAKNRDTIHKKVSVYANQSYSSVQTAIRKTFESDAKLSSDRYLVIDTGSLSELAWADIARKAIIADQKDYQAPTTIMVNSREPISSSKCSRGSMVMLMPPGPRKKGTPIIITMVLHYGPRFTIDAHSNWYVEDVKRAVAAREPQASVDLQRLMHEQTALIDNRTLADYHITSATATIRVFLKIRGAGTESTPLPAATPPAGPATSTLGSISATPSHVATFAHVPDGAYELGKIKITSISYRARNAASKEAAAADHNAQLTLFKKYKARESLAEVYCHFESDKRVKGKFSISYTRYPHPETFHVYVGIYHETKFIKGEFERAHKMIDNASLTSEVKRDSRICLNALREFTFKSLPKSDEKQNHPKAVTPSQKVQAGLMLSKLFVEALAEGKPREIPNDIAQSIVAVLNQCENLQQTFNCMKTLSSSLGEMGLYTKQQVSLSRS